MGRWTSGHPLPAPLRGPSESPTESRTKSRTAASSESHRVTDGGRLRLTQSHGKRPAPSHTESRTAADSESHTVTDSGRLRVTNSHGQRPAPSHTDVAFCRLFTTSVAGYGCLLLSRLFSTLHPLTLPPSLYQGHNNQPRHSSRHGDGPAGCSPLPGHDPVCSRRSIVPSRGEALRRRTPARAAAAPVIGRNSNQLWAVVMQIRSDWYGLLVRRCDGDR